MAHNIPYILLDDYRSFSCQNVYQLQINKNHMNHIPNVLKLITKSYSVFCIFFRVNKLLIWYLSVFTCAYQTLFKFLSHKNVCFSTCHNSTSAKLKKFFFPQIN